MSDHEEGRIRAGLQPTDVALLKQVADEAAQQAVHKTLTAMGLDPTKPFDAQADMQFLRSTRERCEKGGWQAFLIIMGLTVAGAATMMWQGFKAAVK
jgi:hypothetical protein